MTRRYDQYLSTLPAGLASYPEATQRSSILRARLLECDVTYRASLLPPEIAALVRTPPAPDVWLPEVLGQAAMLALGDVCCANDAEFDALTERANRRLLGGAMFSLLFRMLGPRRVVRGAARRWEQFHRGTDLRIIATAEESCTAELRTPPFLMSSELARHYAISMRIAAQLAGVASIEVVFQTVDERTTHFFSRWS